MGMFDTIRAINISDHTFKHNDVSFQTQSLESNMSEYLIFNGELWCGYDGAKGGCRGFAERIDFFGELNIYTSYSDSQFEYWVEYNLIFERGTLSGVDVVRIEKTKDLQDHSQRRPLPRSEQACVTIDLRDVKSEIYEHLHSNLDANLAAIRNAIGDPLAEIIYPVKRDANSFYQMAGPEYRMIHNVMQDFSTLKLTNDKDGNLSRIQSKDLEGNTLNILVDEFWLTHT